MKTENSKTNEPYKSNFNLSQRIDLQSLLKKMLVFKNCLFITRRKI